MPSVNTVTQEKVDAAIAELTRQGKLITIRRVRDILGDGSCTTILARIQSSSLNPDNNVDQKRYVLSADKAGSKLSEHIRWVAENNKPIFISVHKTVIAKLTLEEPVDGRIERVFLGSATNNWSDLLQHMALEKSRWFFKMNYSDKEQSLTYIYLVPVPQATHSNAFNDLWHGPRLLPSQSDQQETQEHVKELLRILQELKDQVLLELALLNNMVGSSFTGADRLSAVPKFCAPVLHTCELAQYEVY